MLKLAYKPAIHWFWGAPLLLCVVLFFIIGIFNNSDIAPFAVTALVLSSAATILGAVIANSAFKKRRSYEALVARWNDVVKWTDPATKLEPSFKLLDDEAPFYSMTSQRYAERWVAQQIQSTTGGGLVPAVVGGVLFGGAGAVAGAVIGKKETTGTATNVYDVVVVDNGGLTITNKRFLFLGARHTVVLMRADMLRVSHNENFIVPEYQGRPAGEMFSVDPWGLSMSMVRRAKDPTFTLPTWPGPVVNNPPSNMPLPSKIDGVLPLPNPTPGYMNCPNCKTWVPANAEICFSCRSQLQKASVLTP